MASLAEKMSLNIHTLVQEEGLWGRWIESCRQGIHGRREATTLD